MLFLMLAGLAGPGCAKEDLLMHKVDVHEVFADTRVAEMADAIADDDAGRVHELAKSTDLRAHGDKNVTLVEWAVFNESKHAFKALLEEGADPALPGMDDSTAGHLAAMVDDPFYLEVLLQKGLDPNLKDRRTGQPLLSATLMGRRAAQFAAVLAAGGNPNAADNMGNTPLHVAGQINANDFAMKLLEAGADPMARNAQNATFQEYLFQTDPKLLSKQGLQSRVAIEEWLRQHGIQVNSGN
jgi:hypothetical protein